MEKIAIIIRREYFSRVRKPSFKYLTLLVPAIFYLLVTNGHKLAQKSEGQQQTVYLVDEYHLLKNQDKGAMPGYKPVSANKALLSKWKKSINKNDVVVYIPANFDKTYQLQLFSRQAIPAQASSHITSMVKNAMMEKQLADARINPELLHRQVVVKNYVNSGAPDTALLALAGFGLAFAVYLAIFLYGIQVMRGVIEEKTSRIVEIIVSSVKPFELMAGKIIGVGLVGLTQFGAWVVAVGFVLFKTNQAEGYMHLLGSHVNSQQLLGIGGGFLLYFLFGYFLYSALFAAVGAAIDNETESQQFMLPLTAPLIFTIAVAKSYIMDDPNGAVAHWLSIIPLTSPIAMVMRLPFGVPVQEIALSLTLLIISFIGITWLAARIYRVGILNYGNEVNYKNLWKWALKSN